jgi:hypothetical protein
LVIGGLGGEVIFPWEKQLASLRHLFPGGKITSPPRPGVRLCYSVVEWERKERRKVRQSSLEPISVAGDANTEVKQGTGTQTRNPGKNPGLNDKEQGKKT